MASEIRVDKINSLSGVGTVTLSPTGVDISGITTAATLKATTGIVTTLTATESAKVGSGVTLSPDGDVFTTGITTSSSVIVGGGVTISESGIEASGIGITCASINGTQIGGRRNLIINGAMQVAQRNTSSTTSGYGSVDRWQVLHNGTDEAPTHAQVDVASGTTPYTLGFRKALRITNGNQTGGAAAADYILVNQRIESQNIAQSGWNYTSTSSFITLSVWVKSSVAQEFHGFLLSADGTRKLYSFSLGSLSADTWTKITKTFPGHSDLQFDNDNAQGILFRIAMYRGTQGTGTITQNQWGTYNTSIRYPNYTSTWYTTNDATFEITGAQLEVGSQATPYEHLSFGEELRLCQRYYYQNTSYGTVAQTNSGETINTAGFGGITMYSATSGRSPFIYHPVMMRATPTTTFYSASNAAGGAANLLSVYSGSTNWDNVASNTTNATTFHMGFKITTNDSFTAGDTLLMGGQFSCEAEL